MDEQQFGAGSEVLRYPPRPRQRSVTEVDSNDDFPELRLHRAAKAKVLERGFLFGSAGTTPAASDET